MPTTPSTCENFLFGLYLDRVDDGENVAVVGFHADPKLHKCWQAMPMYNELPSCILPENNGYFNISTFYENSDGNIQAKKRYVARTNIIMVDDLTKDQIQSLPIEPTYSVETSPNNYQSGYLLDEPLADKGIAHRLMQEIGKSCEGDPGANNIARWARLPFCSNTKQSVIDVYGQPFSTRLDIWKRENKYSPQEIADSFKIDIRPKQHKPSSNQSTKSGNASASQHQPPDEDHLLQYLEQQGMLSGEVSEDGWRKFDCCPWHENHTNQDPQGAGYGPPYSGTNDDGDQYVYARFHCFHGHCADKDISDLYEYVIGQGYQHCDGDAFYLNQVTLMKLANEVMIKTQSDSGYCFEPQSITILKQLKENSIPDWQRVRAQFKNIPSISITSLEKEITKSASSSHKEQMLDQGQVAEIISKRIGAKNILHTQQSFWQWDRKIGVWIRCDDKELHKIIQEYILGLENNAVNDGFVKGCTSLLKNSTYIRDHKFNRNNKCINLLNGELYYENEEWILQEHHRENYFTSQVPITYNFEAKAPQFELFLSSIFEGDDNKLEKIQLIYMCMGYSLLSTARYEKFIILIGNGSNGKSVLLEVLKQLLGNKNVAAVQPSEFDNHFQRAHLQGKLANIVSEIKEGKSIDDNALKSITSGETTTVEHKHKDPFEIEPYSTCWFGTNHMPQTSDFSNGLIRRAIIIPFNRQFEVHEQDKHLKDKLCTELPGILNLAINGLKKLFVDNQFISLPEVESAKDQWRNENDQAAQFIEDCCKIDSRENLPSKDLFEAYLEWASKNYVQKTISQNQLSNRLKRHKVNTEKIKGVRLLTPEQTRGYLPQVVYP